MILAAEAQQAKTWRKLKSTDKFIKLGTTWKDRQAHSNYVDKINSWNESASSG